MAGKAAKRNIGGGTWYSGGNSNVASEAKERKEGGALEAAPKKAGGSVKRKFGGRSVGSPQGKMSGGRLDKRARGGKLLKRATGGGADKNPFSSAGAGARGSK